MRVAACDRAGALAEAPPPGACEWVGEGGDDWDDLPRPLKELWRALDGVVIAVGAAGDRTPFIEHPMADWDALVAINLRLPAAVLRAAGP